MATQQRTVDYLLEQATSAGAVSTKPVILEPAAVLGSGIDRLVAAGDLGERSGLLTRS
ncbi:hypothetical protein [Sphingomonas sp. 1P08PE]|uniref:hypothetical protein n=1 Tax=Sphingomonas sp. 1P08PE TaxID=554122 RepID=UPI0039A34928